MLVKMTIQGDLGYVARQESGRRNAQPSVGCLPPLGDPAFYWRKVDGVDWTKVPATTMAAIGRAKQEELMEPFREIAGG